jgi:hypothetical protein
MVNLGELHRRDYGRLLASLIRMVQDVDLAEDTQQEVFTALVTMSAGLQGRRYGSRLASIPTKRHLGRSCKEA